MIRIWTEQPVREADLRTTLLVEGHPRFSRLHVPGDEMAGWDGYMLEWRGAEVETAREGAPWWQFSLQDGPLNLELRIVSAARVPTPVVAVIEWLPGHPIRQGLEMAGDNWLDEDVQAALYALRHMKGLAFQERGATNLEAFENAVRRGVEWVNDDPNRSPDDLDEIALAPRMGLEVSSLRTQMTRKKYGIRRVRQEVARRVPNCH